MSGAPTRCAAPCRVGLTNRRRCLQGPIVADLAETMVFLAGPRQVGKTTLARQILESSGPGVYLNWDNRTDRKEIRLARWPGDDALVVLDELHKWRSWKGWLKGEFDKHRDHLRFLVTGSARLDVYRKGSGLQGRYHHYRLHPFSLREAAGVSSSTLVPHEELSLPRHGSTETPSALMQFGGFPEPFLAQSVRTVRRWQKDRIDRFFREDVRDLERVQDLASLEILADLLPERVGSPLSLNSLREDLEVSHRTASRWMEILDRLYYVFQLRPHASRQVRTLRKMPKVYLWDSSIIGDEESRFENLVALHLLKLCHYLEDEGGYRMELRYLRDRSGREVDFVVLADRKIWFAVEAKLSEGSIDGSLRYFHSRLEIPWTYQFVLNGKRDFVQDGIRSVPARTFLAALI